MSVGHGGTNHDLIVNGSADFTECKDFSRFYQKSCNVSPAPPLLLNSQPQPPSSPSSPPSCDTDSYSIEPHVSITVGEHVAQGSAQPAPEVQATPVPPQPPRPRNHTVKAKSAVSKTIRKRISALKYRREKRELLSRHRAPRLPPSAAPVAGVTFKCYKCGSTDFPSIQDLNVHQRRCIGGEGDPAPTGKVTRKVYLCSACGSYYENWNLFLHMKEMHKRHICLYCLGMFSQPDKLAQHLQAKHNVVEQSMATMQAFYNAYQGPCYLVCCGCEALFTDQEHFDQHPCPCLPGARPHEEPCPACGLRGAHYTTCPRSERSAFVKKPKKKSSKKRKDALRGNHDSTGDGCFRKEAPTERLENAFAEATARLAEEAATRQFNEKMLQLYRPTKPPDRVTSSIQSIEESINRVVESMGGQGAVGAGGAADPGQDDEEEEDTNVQSPVAEQVPRHVEGAGDLKQEERPAEEGHGGGVMGARGGVAPESDNESSDSEKLTIALDGPGERPEDGIATAGAETTLMHVPIAETEDVKTVLKECVRVSCWNCVYCAHAKRIAVSGKQLALHVLAEHRFVLNVEEHEPEEVKTASVARLAERLKAALPALADHYFNADTFDSGDRALWRPSDRIYECFHCLFATYIHKELCSHNRKMHQKTVFLCIMCKSSFYNYSELLCHLCLGIYIPGQVINPEITYRCYACDVAPLPSAFRLMVHLRRSHNACDICFDVSGSQLQLSTHVWKHKLSHMCYRCGIAYRNKPDITKHLFWKHGTESVTCSKCLQKKWPHVYHFCTPQSSFNCDECTVSFKTAVALKVHKRLHAGQFPYACDKCDEKFISRKLLTRHGRRHDEDEVPRAVKPTTGPEPEHQPGAEPGAEPDTEAEPGAEALPAESEARPDLAKEAKETKAERRAKKKKVLSDVFDLPPVNLSESDDSDEEEAPPVPVPEAPEADMPPVVDRQERPDRPDSPLVNGEAEGSPQAGQAGQVVANVWDDFHNYLVEKDGGRPPGSPFRNMPPARVRTIMLADHDYAQTGGEVGSAALDHDYCNSKDEAEGHKDKRDKKDKKEKDSSSGSSSDSDSSCSCGSNCSCSSRSSSSSSSATESGSSRDRKKDRKKVLKKRKVQPEVPPEPPMEIDVSMPDAPNDKLIRESDLETDETETDEDFYDYNPAREASRILAEKRTQLLANLNGFDQQTAPQPRETRWPEEPPQPPPAKKKSKKKRSGVSVKRVRKKPQAAHNGALEAAAHQPVPPRLQEEDPVHSSGESDSRRPKRKRVPLKFYGFSSEDESDVSSTRKREKVERAEHNTTTPAAPAVAPAPAEDPAPSLIWKFPAKAAAAWRVEKAEEPKVNPIKIRTQPPYPFQLAKPSFQMNGTTSVQRSDKLYCFCQCPYDEVSEMIACDAKDCLIEWFHFECVGIMVPPQGSWYCPECKKKFAAENEFLSTPALSEGSNLPI